MRMRHLLPGIFSSRNVSMKYYRRDVSERRYFSLLFFFGLRVCILSVDKNVRVVGAHDGDDKSRAFAATLRHNETAENHFVLCTENNVCRPQCVPKPTTNNKKLVQNIILG